MSIAERKERQKEELRAKILQAAKELFIKKGYEETSIRNIAEVIDYSPTTIYLYFADKDDMFYAIHQEGFILLNQYFKPLAHVQNPFERLKAIDKAYVAFAMENPEFYNLMFILQSPMKVAQKDHDKWPEGKSAFDFLVNTVQECMDQKYLPDMDPEILSYTVWSMVHGICSLNISCRTSIISEEKQQDLVYKACDTIDKMLSCIHEKNE